LFQIVIYLSPSLLFWFQRADLSLSFFAGTWTRSYRVREKSVYSLPISQVIPSHSIPLRILAVSCFSCPVYVCAGRYNYRPTWWTKYWKLWIYVQMS
jgi:hypothetical protein